MPRRSGVPCPFRPRRGGVILQKKNTMHISQLHRAIERGECSLAFVSERGERIRLDRCVCPSFHSSGQTLNVKICASGEIRKVNRYTIVEFNGKEVYL